MNEFIPIIFYCSIPVICVAGLFSSFLFSIIISDFITEFKERRKENAIHKHKRKRGGKDILS